MVPPSPRGLSQFAPLERLMVETDSPFLAPLPWRGKKNEPAYVIETAKKIALLKNQDADALALQCAHNSKRLLRLPIELPVHFELTCDDVEV